MTSCGSSWVVAGRTKVFDKAYIGLAGFFIGVGEIMGR